MAAAKRKKASKASKAKSAKAGVDRLEELAAGLRKAEIRRLNFDPLVAKRAVNKGLAALAKFRGQLKKGYAAFDLETLELLPEACDRTRALQREVQQVIDSAGALPSILDAIVWRRKLLPVAQALVESGKADAKQLAKIIKGTGFSDNIQDVRDLSVMLEPQTQHVEGILGEGVLRQARELAERALAAQGSAGLGSSEPAERRDRMATVVNQLHDRLRATLAAVVGYAEAAELAPGLSAGRPQPAAPSPAPAPVPAP